MPLFRIHPDEAHDRTVYLRGPEARHIVRVLRMEPGDEIELTDGRGRFLDARIDRCGPDEVHAVVERRREDPLERDAPWSTLALALLKGDHFEIALEKVCELGVHRIVPLRADHCVVRWKDQGGDRKLERWNRIAESATKQSGRSWCPQVQAPMTVAEALRAHAEGFTHWVADEEETARRITPAMVPPGRPHVGWVGPEGAFSAAEKKMLAEAGATAVTLGPFRLRAETAAIVLAAALNQGRSHDAESA